MKPKKLFVSSLTLLWVLCSQCLFSQTYDEISAKYETLEKENPIALPYVKQYIDKAKKENDFANLVQGYKDAIFFNANVNIKMRYADSAIWAAKLSGENDLISKAFLSKGILYYLNLKRYKPALDEYLKAYEYSKNSTDDYQNYKIIYHLGVVKAYLGYYPDALAHFRKCIAFYDPKTKEDLHPNLLYNHTKGYLNSLHQAIVCYRHLGDHRTADSLIKVGLSAADNTQDFALERAYFLKSKATVDYHQRKYTSALANIDQALPEIVKNKDFAWASVSFFYKGKSLMALGNKKQAMQNFLKVDSVFQKNGFILPELRENYELLIHDAKENKDTQRELYYTKTLLKADSIINKDFQYLSPRIHKEYDTQTLIDSKEELESQKSWWMGSMMLLIPFSILVTVLFYYNYKRTKEIRQKYQELQQKLQERTSIVPHKASKVKNSQLSDEIVSEILKKLEQFEEKNGFIEKGMTLDKLAKSINTNANYLSQVINDKRGMNFSTYLAEIRINYITKKLNEDKKFLNYAVDALANECGIASRQNFSDWFFTVNGIRPVDFIKQKKLELEQQETSEWSLQHSS